LSDVRRYELLRSARVDPREDNALNITTDGRKLATDARLLSAAEGDFGNSKINAAANQVHRIWKETAEIRGAQLVFCDIGVHPTPWGFSVYDELVGKLVERGIPRAQVAAIGDADSYAKKQALFEKVRSDVVRVLIGSTQKIGAGTNVQKRLVALHHLDAPWTPAEVEQREGRILRQGNQNAEVAIYRYVTEGSFDAYMWQALETKARFISQVITGKSGQRRAEDIGSQELSYAEVKAIASGNPAVLTLAEADAELQRLEILKKNHLDEQYLARRKTRDLPGLIAAKRQRLEQSEADRKVVTAHRDDRPLIGERRCTAQEIHPALLAVLEGLPRFNQPRQVTLGEYRGLEFGVALHPSFAPEGFSEGELVRRDTLSREHHGPRAIWNAVERLAGGYDRACTELREELAIAEWQLRDFQLRRDQPFAPESYLAELTMLRDQLKEALSKPQPTEDPPPASDPSRLAERIKELRAAHGGEAAAERLSRRETAAAEPVTRIILRSQQVNDADHGEPGSEQSFAQRIEDRRTPQRPGDGMDVAVVNGLS
jgi:hypothetical protein